MFDSPMPTSIALDTPDTPESVTIVGTMQHALGCPNNWQSDCDQTTLIYEPDTDLWTADFQLPAGSYHYKVALNGKWDENYGLKAQRSGPNIFFRLDKSGIV